jgi:hypothetical protein
MSYETKILVANLFQGVYFFSVLLMWIASYERLKVCGMQYLTFKQKGEFWGSTIAGFTFMTAQLGGLFGLLNPSDYLTAPISFFVWSVFYNMEEYAGVSVFQYFKHIK